MPATEIYERIVTAKIFIDEHFEEPLDLGLIAQKACLSPFHFHRLFSRVYKKTPHQYLTSKRIEKAKDLLSRNYAVKDVCSEVGFESHASFSILFKRKFGFAPQYYRNMAWLKKQQAKKQPQSLVPRCFIEQYHL